MNWETIVIDDEELARQRLIRLLSSYDEIRLIGQAGNGLEGLQMIESLKPKLIFLDIEMPGLNGFEMLARLKEAPKVIFTTAYDHYALKAFEENFVDYLLKPIEKERLEKTILKLHQHQVQQIPLDVLLQQLNPNAATRSLTVKTGDRILLVRLTEIVYAEAEDKYVFLYTSDGKKHLTDYTITGLASKLTAQFFQINRGTIINCDHIREIRKGFNGSKIFIMAHPSEARLTSGRSFSGPISERFDL